MDAHKGGLTVTSEGEGKGSTFTVTLPLASTIIANTTDAIVQFISTRRSSLSASVIHPMADTSSVVMVPDARMQSQSQLEEIEPFTPRVVPVNKIPSWTNVTSNKGSSKQYYKKRCERVETYEAGTTLSTEVEQPCSKKPVVLVVDDVASNRKMLKRLLVGRCSCTIEAVDGQEALEKVREAMSTELTIEVITMDYQMPVMDGPTATRKIRELGYSGIILGVTGNVLKEDMKKFLAAGANRVLTKPLSMAIFDATILELLTKT